MQLRGMKQRARLSGWAVYCLAVATAIFLIRPGGAWAFQEAVSGGHLQTFESEEDLRRYLVGIRRARDERIERARREMERRYGEGNIPPPPPPPPSPPPPMEAAAPADESITNNQTAGVDEGGIVKVRGDLLVILRRGRLFTVSIADGGLHPIDHIDAYPPDTDGSGSWYDEMLIAGDRVIVIGYSYSRGGTEVNRFRLSPDGQLNFEDAHHLRSNDYYSVDNYASRLIGNRLIFYSPLNLFYGEDPMDALPGVKRWDGDAANQVFERVARPSQIYITPALRRSPREAFSTLHSVTDCDVASANFDCTARGVIAGGSREFYVAADAVYLWVSDADYYTENAPQTYSHIYRLPLTSEAPSAVGSRGAPIDQFSFRADNDAPAGPVLNVLVRAGSGNEAMWEPEAPQGTISLIRVPLTEFGDGSQEIRQRFYRHLEQNDGYLAMENRFVGDHLIYGHGMAYSWNNQYSSEPLAYAVPLNGGSIARFAMPHGIERIEIMGSDAVIVGSNTEGDLGLSAIELAGTLPQLGDAHFLRKTGQGESRSHAYFYRPDPDSPDGASGTLGLPIARQLESPVGRLFGSAVSMQFLRRDDRIFSEAGALVSDVSGAVEDGCRASCVDWYGNARPIFLRGRILALLGYELVEGRMAGGRIAEIARINFAPPPPDPEPPTE